MKVLGISGSPRNSGNTDIILREILRGAEESGMETEILFLREYTINSCIGCEKCRKSLKCSQFNDGMNLIYPKVEEADILITGSPVYNYNITGLMKIFIDRLYPYYIFYGKRPGKYSSRLKDKKRDAFVFSVCEQTDPEEDDFAIDAMSRPLEALGYSITDKMAIRGYFEKGSVSRDENITREAYTAGTRLSEIK